TTDGCWLQTRQVDKALLLTVPIIMIKSKNPEFFYIYENLLAISRKFVLIITRSRFFGSQPLDMPT
ncbi:MAG: hypothetical protein M3449_02665, partial [Acidobacteriota bacterium]|nr:hypothetical protein [Acidobacteriota bacterium]